MTMTEDAPTRVLTDHANAVLTFTPRDGLVLRGDFRGDANEPLRSTLKTPARWEADGSLAVDKSDRPIGFGMRWSKMQGAWYFPGSNQTGSLTSRHETVAHAITELLVAHGITVHVNLGDGPVDFAGEGEPPAPASGGTTRGAEPLDLEHLGEVIPGGGLGQANPGWKGALADLTRGMTLSTLNTLIRQDITQAKRAGQLPRNLEVGVRKDHSTIYLSVKGPEPSPETVATLEAITSRYNAWSPYDSQVDNYCHPRFYAYVQHDGRTIR